MTKKNNQEITNQIMENLKKNPHLEDMESFLETKQKELRALPDCFLIQGLIHNLSITYKE